MLRILLALAGAVAVYALLGGVALPAISRRLIVEKTEARLGRPVALDAVTVNPFTLHATLRGFRIFERDGRTPFASFDTLTIDASPASAYRWAPMVDVLTLRGLRIHAVRDAPTHYNFSDILDRLADDPAKSAKQPSTPPRFWLENLRVIDAAADLDDRPNHAHHELTQVDLTIPAISDFPDHVRDRVAPSFSARLDGSDFTLSGQSVPFDPSLRTRFDVVIHALDLPRYLAYVPATLPAHVDGAQLDGRLSIRFVRTPAPSLELAGRVVVSNAALSTADGALARVGKLDLDIASLDPLAGTLKLNGIVVTDAATMRDQWKVRSFAARNVDASLGKHVVRIGAIETADGDLALVRGADGAIEVPRLTTGAGASSPWNLTIGQATAQRYRVAFTDRTVAPAASRTLDVQSAHLENISTEHGLEGRGDVIAKLDAHGSLQASSTFSLAPLKVNATIDARGIELAPFRAYVTQYPAVAVRSGTASAKGTLVVAGNPQALHVSFAGTAEVDKFATTDTLNKEELLNWRSVKLRGGRFEYAPGEPLRIDAADVAVDGAYSRLVVNPQGKLNVQQLIAATEAQPHAAPEPGPREPRNIHIDRITFTDSRLNFTDHYIRPNYTADVGALHGSITKLSSDPASRAIVALEGRWDASSPVLIAGTMNPLRGDLFLDVAAHGEDIDLTQLNAYSQRYAGYGIRDGRLTLDVKYHVDNGRMEGRNRLVVDRLTFGDRVESPDATSLPVVFLVNLLKDKNGRIDLQLPISGSLEDPHFELGAVIAQMFTRRMKEAESSPFALIAGGGNDNGSELSYVEFQPGTAELTDAARGKLDRLARLLQDRPGLKLALAARFDSGVDIPALERAAREKKLAALPESAPKEAREKIEQEKVDLAADAQRTLVESRDREVRTYLIGAGGLPPERVLVATEPVKAQVANPPPSRVDFALR